MEWGQKFGEMGVGLGIEVGLGIWIWNRTWNGVKERNMIWKFDLEKNRFIVFKSFLSFSA